MILNLAVWFALHTLFADVRLFAAGGLRLELPVLASVRPAALFLSACAVVAMFRFRIGALPVLAACAAAGLLYTLASPA